MLSVKARVCEEPREVKLVPNEQREQPARSQRPLQSLLSSPAHELPKLVRGYQMALPYQLRRCVDGRDAHSRTRHYFTFNHLRLVAQQQPLQAFFEAQPGLQARTAQSNLGTRRGCCADRPASPLYRRRWPAKLAADAVQHRSQSASTLAST